MRRSDIGGAGTGNAARLHDATAERHGDAIAVEAGERFTHRELRNRSRRVAGGLLDCGLAPGDALICYLPNCPAYVVGALGALRAGLALSPVNPQYKARELGYQIDDTDAAAVLTHPALREHAAAALSDRDRDPTVIVAGGGRDGDLAFADLDGDPTTVERNDDDVALLPYTSGTTGRPKGVELTHRNLRAQALAHLSNPADDLDDEAVRSLVWLPLYHITGFVHSTWQPLVRGGRVYLRDPGSWDPGDALALIEREGITHFVGVTAMYVDMVDADGFGERDLSSLEQASEGGAKMALAVQREFEDVAGVAVTEGYGMTETTGATHTQVGSTHGPRHGTVGQPLRMVDCRVVDGDGEVPIGEEGELFVRGPQVMAGYRGRPEATDAAFTDDGYLRTGDVARRDGENYYEIVDRRKHVIVTAGYNVYPSEIEELLGEHEAVAEAAVVGVPDERRNEVPEAYVVVRPGVEAGSDVTAEELRQFCLDRVAEYKHPREVEFLDELPRTASGKIQKFKLEERDAGEG